MREKGKLNKLRKGIKLGRKLNLIELPRIVFNVIYLLFL